MATIFAQRQIRLAALTALQGANLGTTIYSPGDWNTPETDLPVILLRSSGNSKESIAKSAPDFTTTVRLELQARTEAVTAEAAQDAVEMLGDAIEQALFTNYGLVGLVQQFSSVVTRTEVNSEGRVHIASLAMTVDCELFEAFDPMEQAMPPALTSIGIHVDAIEPFDPSGTYANPAFPSAVQPAPRTSGPDGRDEGALEINLSQ